VVNITATWCGPCERLKPKFADLSAGFPDVAFVTVDIDALSESMLNFLAVATVPSVLVVRDGKEVARLVGVSHKRPGRPIAAAIREHLLSENWPERRHTGVNGRGEWT
jgi:thioredoxin 1|tara:strand:- start:1341 stop:1664 length:324 start_codon:yes stop_codon:yes gene_type:complete